MDKLKILHSEGTVRNLKDRRRRFIRRNFEKERCLMAWVYLVIAGLLEIGWPIGLKISQNP